MSLTARIKQVEKANKDLLSRAVRTQMALYNAIREYYMANLELDGRTIKQTNSNRRNARRLRKLINNFNERKWKPLLTNILKDFIKITNLNYSYFKSIEDFPNKIKPQVQRSMLLNLGVEKIKDDFVLSDDGWLNSLKQTDNIYREIKQIATRAVNQGIDIKEFNSRLTDYLLPDDKLGPLVSHLRTNAQDAFRAFDRSTADTYASEVGLVFFVYQGGHIDDSRAFCCGGKDKKSGRTFKNKVGMVWHVNEVYEHPEWLGNWDGKNSNYDPLTDMGGHNCRHFKNYVSKRYALKRRPELQKYL